ncbi:hypothetical protein DRO27_02795 [Candidatus Bathyarchaeota archaeon]|nr:MAG: hypothetical protein DRO27_02795 [Candidatus Bathyarchaeota archaeon]
MSNLEYADLKYLEAMHAAAPLLGDDAAKIIRELIHEIVRMRTCACCGEDAVAIARECPSCMGDPR